MFRNLFFLFLSIFEAYHYGIVNGLNLSARAMRYLE